MNGYEKIGLDENKREYIKFAFINGYVREVSCQEIMSALDSRYRRLKLDNFNRNDDFEMRNLRNLKLQLKQLTYNLDIRVGEVMCKRVLDEMYEGGDKWL